MAGDWIPWQKGLSRKPEVVAIARKTGRSRFEVVGLLIEFWEWVDSEAVDGTIAATSLEDLSDLIPGSDLNFWTAVVKAGWLCTAKSTSGLVIPNFDRWVVR